MTRRSGLIGLVALIAAVAIGLPGVVLSRSILASRSGAGSERCTLQARSLAGVSRAMALAHPGEIVCLKAGSYMGHLSLNARRAGDVTLQAAPGAHVAIGEIDVGGSHLVVRNLWIKGEVVVDAGASHITIAHNDISGGGEGVVFETSDCTVPNAPDWPGCSPLEPVTDVVIVGNRIHDIGQPGTEDAIHLDNWRNVTIANNELDHIIESGEHTDCVQSVYGGSDLTFTHNYEHDNDCQGLFIKDGDASDVSVTDNLFLRDDEPDARGERFGNLAQLWNTQGLTIEQNTIWDGKGIVLVSEDPHNSPTATIDHNLFSHLSISKPIGRAYALSESYNVFGQPPSSFVPSATDRAIARPRFVDSAGNLYRLARNPHHVGIDWDPASQHYGPQD